MTRNNSILIAMDGSNQAMDAVRYAAGFFPPDATGVTLMHVNPEVPEAFLDLRNEPALGPQVIQINTWLGQVRKNIDYFMETSKGILTQAGFPDSAVSLKVQSRKSGIARDLIAEAHNGYDLVIIGRAGISKIKDVVLGSIANKLVSKVNHIPVIVVGGFPECSRVLIAFDGSTGAMKAVDCAGRWMVREDRDIQLCYVVRSLNIHLGGMQLFDLEQESLWLDLNKKQIDSGFYLAEKRLINAGFHPAAVNRRILENTASRSVGIKNGAESSGCGTIVIGRRGISMVEEFLIGRVSRKVLQMADQMAVWVVS